MKAEDLREKTLEEFNYHARGEFVTPHIVKMRYFHYENRRRKKIKMIVDYIKENRSQLIHPKQQEREDKLAKT